MEHSHTFLVIYHVDAFMPLNIKIIVIEDAKSVSLKEQHNMINGI